MKFRHIIASNEKTMDKGIKIVKKLMRLMKSLVAIGEDGDGNLSGIADSPGRYENFTGGINWKETHGKVENATFELTEESDRPIVWHKGIWADGTWHNGIWNGGTWEDGDWEGGIWMGGTWNFGDWRNGKWYDGTWNGGIWKYGYDSNGNCHLKNDSPYKWKMRRGFEF